MDLGEMIRILREQMNQLDQAIAALEHFGRNQNGIAIPKVTLRRGRKKGEMTPDERAEVSQRMKKYWAGRRKGKSA